MFDWKRQLLHDCPSTNGELKARLEAGTARVGDVLIANRQTAGRGRMDRAWVSPAGNIALSAAWELPSHRERAPLLSLTAGIAVVETVADVAGIRSQLKWPNDVLISNRKVAGILCESVVAKNAAVIGIGVNLNSTATDFPPELRDGIITVRDATGSATNAEAFIVRLLENLRWRLFDATTDAPTIIARTETLLAWRGRSVRITGGNGINDADGDLVGLDRQGFLVLSTDDGNTRCIAAGDLSLRERI